MARKKSVTVYKSMIRALRKTELVDEYGEVKSYGLTGDTFTASKGFDLRSLKNLTPNQKGKVTRYFNELQRQVAATQPLHVYKPRNKSRQAKARKLVGAEHFPSFTGVFLQTPTENKPRVREDAKGNLVLYDEGVKQSYVYFNKLRLAVDAEAEIERAIAAQAPKAKAFKIQAGRYVIDKETYDKETIKEGVVFYQTKYSAEADDGTLANNHWRNWMHGLIALAGKWDDVLRVDTLNKELAEQKRAQRKKVRAREKKRLQRAAIKRKGK